jgi:hypothetical protein
MEVADCSEMLAHFCQTAYRHIKGDRFHHECKMFENVYRGKYLDLKWRKQLKNGENCIMRSFIICSLYEVLG